MRNARPHPCDARDPGNGEGWTLSLAWNHSSNLRRKLVEEGKAPTSREAKRLLMPVASQPRHPTKTRQPTGAAIIEGWERAWPVARDQHPVALDAPGWRVIKPGNLLAQNEYRQTYYPAVEQRDGRRK
jgi:hypothetical protein